MLFDVVGCPGEVDFAIRQNMLFQLHTIDVLIEVPLIIDDDWDEVACLIVFAYTFGAFEVPYLLGQTYPMTLPVWAYRNYSDIDLMARPEGIATGLVIAGVIIAAIVLSQALTRMARRRGAII